MEETVAGLRCVIKALEEENKHLREKLKNKEAHVELLQNMVRSYQADNERDYSAHD